MNRFSSKSFLSIHHPLEPRSLFKPLQTMSMTSREHWNIFNRRVFSLSIKSYALKIWRWQMFWSIRRESKQLFYWPTWQKRNEYGREVFFVGARSITKSDKFWKHGHWMDRIFDSIERFESIPTINNHYDTSSRRGHPLQNSPMPWNSSIGRFKSTTTNWMYWGNSTDVHWKISNRLNLSMSTIQGNWNISL